MRAVCAFVAEIAVDLKDFADPAHKQALKEKLRRNAHKKVNIKSIHMGLERARSSTAMICLKHWRFSLDVTSPVKITAKGRNDFGPVTNHITHFAVCDHSQIRLAGALLFAQPLMECRKRPERLCRNLPRIHHNGQFTGIRYGHGAVKVQMVAQIYQLLVLFQRLFAYRTLGNHTLDMRAVP